MNSLIKFLRNSTWFYIFLLLAFSQPAYLTQNALLNSLLNVIKLAGFLLICVLWFVDIRKHIQKTFNILFLLLWVELLVSTLLSDDASMFSYITKAIPVLGSCFVVEEIALHSPAKGLKGMYLYFSTLVLINTMTVFLYPNAMYANNRGIWVCWFLGEDNSGYFFYILASTFAMLYCNYITKRITLLAVLDWVSAFVFVFHNDIATGIACQIIWLFLVAGYQFKIFRKLFKAKYALYIMLAGFVFLVLMRRLILAPIVEALGRNITISGRTKIWDRTIALILKKPVFGYGICDGDVYAKMIGLRGITMAHDWLLNLGFAGGVLVIILHIFQLVFAFREGNAFRSTTFYRYVVIGMIIIFIRAVTEGSNWEGYFVMPAMIAYSKEFLNGIYSENIARKRTIRFTFGNYSRRSKSI